MFFSFLLYFIYLHLKALKPRKQATENNWKIFFTICIFSSFIYEIYYLFIILGFTFCFTGNYFPVKQKSTLTYLVNVLLCLVTFCPLHYPEHCDTKRRQWIGNGIFSSIAFRLHSLIACRSALICFCTAETGFVAV